MTWLTPNFQSNAPLFGSANVTLPAPGVSGGAAIIACGMGFGSAPRSYSLTSSGGTTWTTVWADILGRVYQGVHGGGVPNTYVVMAHNLGLNNERRCGVHHRAHRRQRLHPHDLPRHLSGWCL